MNGGTGLKFVEDALVAMERLDFRWDKRESRTPVRGEKEQWEELVWEQSEPRGRVGPRWVQGRTCCEKDVRGPRGRRWTAVVARSDCFAGGSGSCPSEASPDL